MTSIPRLIDELFRALDAKDAAGICALLADDAAMVDEITRGWMIGRDNLRAHLEATLSTVESIESEVNDLRVQEKGSFATATCTLVQNYRFGGSRVEVVAPTSLSLERTDGGWRIVHMHAVPLADG